jgi:hypothetical protein
VEIIQVIGKGTTVRLTSYGGYPVKQVHLQEVPVRGWSDVYELGNSEPTPMRELPKLTI